MANAGFTAIERGQALSPGLISELQGMLMRGTPLHAVSGRLRDSQVVIGVREDVDLAGLPVKNARFVPAPPGMALETGVSDLVAWMRADHRSRVVQLSTTGVLTEPTLTVSPWFESRRADYYDRLLRVSTHNAWDDFVSFFAEGLRSAADQTRRQMLALVAVQGELKERLRAEGVRAESAHGLIDFAVANPSFTVRSVEAALGLSYQRANKVVRQLVDLQVLNEVNPGAYRRRFVAPRVIGVLTGGF